MFRSCLQLMCLSCIALAINQADLAGEWNWIKSFRGGDAGGYMTPADLGYSMHMNIRNDSVYIYHNDTLKTSDSLNSLTRDHPEAGTQIELRSDTLIIKETLIEAIPASYWKKTASTNPPSEKPPVPFLCSRLNYAWGYTHNGWLIDSSGAIRSYSFTKADSIGYIGLTDTLPFKVHEKLLAKSTPTGKKVSVDTLLSKLALIEPASGGTISFSGGCFDFGIYRYSCFRFGANAPHLKETICYQLGDEGVCNSASAAKKIARWLNSIDSVSLQICKPPDSCLNFATSIIKDGASWKGNNAVLISTAGKVLHAKLAKNGTIAIRAYSLRGELLAKPFERFLPAGVHRIVPAHLFTGIRSKKPIVLEISLNGVRSETRTAVISQGR